MSRTLILLAALGLAVAACGDTEQVPVHAIPTTAALGAAPTSTMTSPTPTAAAPTTATNPVTKATTTTGLPAGTTGNAGTPVLPPPTVTTAPAPTPEAAKQAARDGVPIPETTPETFDAGAGFTGVEGPGDPGLPPQPWPTLTDPPTVDFRLLACDTGGTTGPTKVEAQSMTPSAVTAALTSGACTVIDDDVRS